MTAHNALGMFLLALVVPVVGCSSTDYDRLWKYYSREPKTVVILPAINDSTDAEAGHLFESTIVKPLVDRGYYVFPIELVTEILAREGITEAGEAWEIPPQKFFDYFGADAVLYTKIETWDTVYAVIASNVTVGVEYTLVDTRSGVLLWHNRHMATVSSNPGGGGHPIATLISSVVSAAITAATVDYVPLAYRVNVEAMDGLPVGHYHSEYTRITKNLAAWKKKQEVKSKE